MKSLLNYKNWFTASLVLASSWGVSAQNAPMVLDQAQNAPLEAVKDDWKSSLERDGVYDKTRHTGVALPWQPVREIDVLWKKRVWREINTLEKQNMPFRYKGDDETGGGLFIEIVMDALKKGKIAAYSDINDRFTNKLSKDDILDKLQGTKDSTQVVDPVTGAVKIQVINNGFDPDNVTKYRIKEDRIFDRNLGRVVVRIIGIAPMKDVVDPNTREYRASRPMFWIHYPELRNILAQYEIFNPDNDVARLTWDDYFEGRYFSSRIIKVSNPFDDDLNSAGYKGLDQLYEGQREEEKLFNKEHDMWVY